MSTKSLPFELDHDEVRAQDIAARSISGTVTLEGEALVIQFSLEGTAAAPQSVRIPLAHIDRFTMTGGAVKSPRLLIEVTRDDLLTTLPWAAERMCVMRLRRADGQRLRELIEEVEVKMAEIRGREEQNER